MNGSDLRLRRRGAHRVCKGAAGLAFAALLFADVAAFAQTAPGPAGRMPPASSERLTDLQAEQEAIRAQSEQLGGSRSPLQSLNNAQTRVNELDELIERMHQTFEKVGLNTADIDADRRRMDESWSFSAGDVVQEGGEEMAEKQIEKGLARACSKGVGRVFFWASLIGDVVDYGGRKIIKEINERRLEDYVRQGRQQASQVFEVLSELYCERAAEREKVKALRALRTRDGEIFNEIATERARLQGTPPATRHAVLDRDRDAADDAEQQHIYSKEAAERGIGLAGPPAKKQLSVPSPGKLKSLPVKAKLVTDSQQYCTFGPAAPTTVSFAPTDSPAAPKPPAQPAPGGAPSAGGGTPPGKPAPPDKPTAGNPPGGGSTPAKPGNAPPPPEKPQADGGPSQVAGGPPSGRPYPTKKRPPHRYGPPDIGSHGDPMVLIDPSKETSSPEDILDDLGDEEFNRSVLGTQFGPLNESPASKPPAAETGKPPAPAGTPPQGPQQASGSPEDILSEIEEGSTPSKADTTKTPPSAAPPPETPAGKSDKPTTVTSLPGAPQTATPVAIYFKAKETVLEGEADKNLELKQQVVKLVPAQEPALPMTTGSNGVPSDAVKTAVAKHVLDTGFDRSPVQCTTGANGECSAEIAADERELYGFPKTGAGGYRAELNTLQNSGGVVENLSGLLKSKLMDLPPPKGLHVVKSTFKIGDRSYVRLTYAGPADRIGALTSDYAKRFGKNYQIDFCEEKKPGPPPGADLISFRARGRELPEATVKLEYGGAAR